METPCSVASWGVAVECCKVLRDPNRNGVFRLLGGDVVGTLWKNCCFMQPSFYSVIAMPGIEAELIWSTRKRCSLGAKCGWETSLEELKNNVVLSDLIIVIPDFFVDLRFEGIAMMLTLICMICQFRASDNWLNHKQCNDVHLWRIIHPNGLDIDPKVENNLFCPSPMFLNH